MTDTPKATAEERAKFLDTTSAKEKVVSPKTMERLNLSADAIAATKRAIEHQGNQKPSLKATNMNSQYRLMAMRDPRAWDYTPEAETLAGKHKEADVAAKAEIAHGGNCGEHSWVAYHYLREHAKGETINRVSPSYIDHAFTIIGDLKKDKDDELAVSDPWTNKPISCLWEDHFAKGDRAELSSTTMVADGNSYKKAIMGGLKLSEFGKKLVEKADSDADTKDKLDKSTENHFWDHDDTRKGGAHFQYKEQPPAVEAPKREGEQPTTE